MSSEQLRPDGCDAIRALIDPYLSGELTDEQIRMVESHLPGCENCAMALRNRRRIRERLKEAVEKDRASDALRESIRGAIAGEARRNGAILRPGATERWVYAVAATLLVIIGGWGLLRYLKNDPSTPSPERIAAINARTARVLQIGMGDHIYCAIQHRNAELRFTLEQLETSLGPEYFGLVPLLNEKVEGSEVVMGHRCIANGRRFVHLIFFDGDQIVSLAITRKGDTAFPHEREAMASEKSGIPLYHARLRDAYELEVAGFETRDYLVFLVSEPRNGGNLRVAGMLAPETRDFLDRVGPMTHVGAGHAGAAPRFASMAPATGRITQ